MQRIALGTIDAVPAVGNQMAIKVTGQSGQSFELRMDADHTRKFAEAIAAVRAGWDQAPVIEAAPQSYAPPPPPVKARMPTKPAKVVAASAPKPAKPAPKLKARPAATRVVTIRRPRIAKRAPARKAKRR